MLKFIYSSFMRKLIILLVTSFLSIATLLSWHGETFAAWKCWFPLSSGSCGYENPPYCTDGKCTLTGWLDAAKNAVWTTVTQKKFSTFVKDIVTYFLWFVTLVAVIYIIYGGFQLMTGAGDEEKNKKAKNIIVFVAIGIIIMWLAYSIVDFIIWSIGKQAYIGKEKNYTSWSIIPSANAYTESDSDTFREYQNKLRIATQDLESELKIHKKVNTSNLSNLKNLLQSAYERLPDFGDAGTENDTMKRAIDTEIEIAIANPDSVSKVSSAISSVSSFISSARIESVQWNIKASPNSGNSPLTVSFEATSIVDPSGTTPDQMNYIWWMRENGGNRRELGRGKTYVHTFTQEWTYTVFLDVISWSRNSKKKIDVLPLSTSTTIEVKPKRGEIVLLLNGVNVSNINEIKINPEIGKRGVIFDATASRATWGSVTETSWDFGNGDVITYKWSPSIEREIFANEWNYNAKLTLQTNNGESITKDIRIIVRNPSATIEWDTFKWNVGDVLSFSAISYFTNTTNVEYSWQIQDENNKKVINNVAWTSLSHKFEKIWEYILTLTARSANGQIDTHSEKVIIESSAPVINLEPPLPVSSEQPNIILFSAKKTYDPDTMSVKWLLFTWRIDGQKIDLGSQKNNGAEWTYAFDTIGTHTVSLTVSNSYGKISTLEKEFTVTSLLSANILITPRVAPIWTPINFIAQSEKGNFFEWDMGDGSPIVTGSKKIIQHVYQKTGTYEVVLKVSTAQWNESNEIRRKIYVTDTNSPFSMIQVSNVSWSSYYDPEACGGSGATIVNRSEITTLDGSKSINIDGSTNDLSYTWNYLWKTRSSNMISEKITELWCYPVKLTVKSMRNGASHTSTEYIYIKNLPPEFTSISTNIDTTKKDSQRVLVQVNANGVVDPDGVITSYIWYYTTESDKEPQNIQITQKPSITFVLPNITEKYYFGVILEDNDGAKMNSLDDKNRQQTPLILDNQNSNIYLPLITLTTPKNSVLVGENVYMSVEAKTILGTNITKNAEYAWDFDGDGRFEEKSSNPSINHIFKKSGTYSLKVKVTYNGVSNTKYSTIYVKNPLKADVTGYILEDGGLYLMNTSEWVFDTARWMIWNDNIESPYSVSINSKDAIILSGDIVGTLLVSNAGTEKSVYTIKKADLITLNSTSGINYQSSPKATNDTITIHNQSDRLALSMIGNKRNITNYAIDTDIRVDSDLDGIPDNDIDNKSHNSYTDWSLFSINDFADSRIRERKIRITLFDGVTKVETKDITLILDFLPENSSVSWENETIADINGGNISSADKTKLESLVKFIRETDSSDRIILMQKYNTLVENWNDTFSKAKTLIDIQEIVTDLNINETKKQEISQLIDAMLVWEAMSNNEITLATKLIQDLIPADNSNRATILDKLNTISNNPWDLENNKILWKEILELIKNDPSIEDKYKIHIRNQLLIIINGGQTSIPTEETASNETSSTWGSLLGFISGVVTVVWIILWLIVFVILIGYILYKLSNKKGEIGFQDYLIDSIFHAKKTAPIDTSSNTSIVTQKVESPEIIRTPSITEEPKTITTTDPLASFVPPVISQTPTTVDPIMGWSIATPPLNETTNIPDWLKPPMGDIEPVSIDSNSKSETNAITTESPIEITKQPETVINTENTTNTTAETTTSNASLNNDVTLPDWMTQSTTEDEQSTTESHTNTEPVATEVIDTQFGGNTVESTTEDSPVIATSTTPSQVENNSLPDWLIESVKPSISAKIEDPIVTEVQESPEVSETPAEKTQKTPKKWSKKKEEVKAPTSDENNTNSDIPDWLK